MARTTIGIITADSETDPSLKIFNSLKDKFDCNIKVINPLGQFDIGDFSDVGILYHRVSGRGEQIVSQKIAFYKKAVQETGLPHIGNLEIIDKIKNKYFQVIEANKALINTPKTVLIDNKNIDECVQSLNYPFVLKCVYSYGGNDVFLIHNSVELKKQILSSEQYLAQEFIKLKDIIDYRVYVVGYEVIGGIIRENKIEGEFRANTTRGGSATFFHPDDTLSDLAIKYAKHLKTDVLAVDFIKKGDEYIFIECNDAFSVKTDNEPKKIIIAESILKYCLKKARGKQNV